MGNIKNIIRGKQRLLPIPVKDLISDISKTIHQPEIIQPHYLDGICWGGSIGEMALPHSEATSHFAYIGATGSGKTVSIRLLLQTVLPCIRHEGLDHRAVIYDAKQDIIPILRGLNLNIPIKTLNPFDAEGYAWDIAEDIKERAHALEISLILIPPDNSQQPFFGDAARHLLEGVITSFMLNYLHKKVLNPDAEIRKWTFRDIIYAMESRERIIEVLNNHEETRELIPTYFGHPEVSKSIMSTVATKIKPYKAVAALWHEATENGQTLSLNDWFRSVERKDEPNFILVLGNDETAREAIDRINQVIFKRISQLILSQRDLDKEQDYYQDLSFAEGKIDKSRHWIILDEARNASYLDGLNPLMTKGRSKGACIVLGFQDIEGLHSVYGEDEANEIIGQCSHYAIFRLQSPATAEWASNLFGVSEVLEEFTDVSVGQSYSFTEQGFEVSTTSGHSSEASRRIAFRDKKEILAAQFLYIKPVNRQHGLFGWYKSPSIETPYGIAIPFSVLFGSENSSKKGWQKSIDKSYEIRWRGRGSYLKCEQQKLKSWTPEEREALGLIKPLEVDRQRQEERRRAIQQLKAVAEQTEALARDFAELVFYRESELTAEEKEYLNKFPKAKDIFKKILNQLKKEAEGKSGNLKQDTGIFLTVTEEAK